MTKSIRAALALAVAAALPMACSEAPEGHARWSLRLLADKLVKLEIVDEDISYQTVRRTLKKTRSSPI